MLLLSRRFGYPVTRIWGLQCEYQSPIVYLDSFLSVFEVQIEVDNPSNYAITEVVLAVWRITVRGFLYFDPSV